MTQLAKPIPNGSILGSGKSRVGLLRIIKSDVYFN